MDNVCSIVVLDSTWTRTATALRDGYVEHVQHATQAHLFGLHAPQQTTQFALNGVLVRRASMSFLRLRPPLIANVLHARLARLM